MEKDIKESIKNDLFQNIKEYDLKQLNISEIINTYEDIIYEINEEYKKKTLSLLNKNEKIIETNNIKK